MLDELWDRITYTINYYEYNFDSYSKVNLKLLHNYWLLYLLTYVVFLYYFYHFYFLSQNILFENYYNFLNWTKYSSSKIVAFFFIRWNTEIQIIFVLPNYLRISIVANYHEQPNILKIKQDDSKRKVFSPLCFVQWFFFIIFFLMVFIKLHWCIGR